jgi:HAD superfamily hydrolase (TIGR01509 family)
MANRLVIFDLDGVLIDSRDLHFHALNAALANVGEQFPISREEHLSLYDGLNTTRKLDMLTERKGLPKASHQKVWEDKQIATFDLIKAFPVDSRAVEVFKLVKQRGWNIAVASNSIRETVKLALMAIGVLEYVDYHISNEDVKRPKPFPEMYWKCMTELNCLPKNTLIVEDSHLGRQGALDSGCHLLAVENAWDWDMEKIMEEIDIMENKDTHKPIPWRDKKLNVLIPMAGAGSRFAEAGYTFPKPLIEVRGKPMIQVVVENLNIEANYIFVCQKEHYAQYDLEHVLNNIAPNCKIVLTEGVTEGAACTALLAKEYIDSENPLLFANSDQFLLWNSNEVLYAFQADGIDGGMVNFKASHPRWSYAKIGDDGFVSEVAEKKVISDSATTGIYWWRHGSDFVKYAEQMISKDARVNGEFYTCPVFNEAIQDGKKIRVKTIEEFYGTGTPEDLDNFLNTYKGKL